MLIRGRRRSKNPPLLLFCAGEFTGNCTKCKCSSTNYDGANLHFAGKTCRNEEWESRQLVEQQVTKLEGEEVESRD